MSMKLHNLGRVPWLESQLIYHSLALLGREALVLVSPASPYVCIGFHQDVDQEVDLDYCRQHNIPVFRREVGGGAVFLDGNQLFFQLILRRDNPIAPKRIDAFYKKFMEPVINVHRRIGLEVEYKPVNDIVIDHRKISGTGAGEIGDCIVFVGNLIVDFDYETMAKVLKIPDEKFRDKVRKTIEDNLSTLTRELGPETLSQWNEDALNHMMAEEFQHLLGPMSPGKMDAELLHKMEELEPEMTNKDWLYMRGKKVPGRVVKVRAGLEVVHRVHKAAGGLMRADFAIEDGRLKDVNISGDFFCFPNDAVKRLSIKLDNCSTTSVPGIVAEFIKHDKIDMPGITYNDWMHVLKS